MSIYCPHDTWFINMIWFMLTLITWLRSVCHVSSLFFDLLLILSINITQRKQWQPTPVLLPGQSHGRRSLVGCSPWGHEKLDMTEQLHFHFSLSCIGEGNGNPLQCSCLENLRDGGAWWAAIYGVTQSRTRLKWLSSSSSINITTFLKTSWIPPALSRPI